MTSRAQTPREDNFVECLKTLGVPANGTSVLRELGRLPRLSIKDSSIAFRESATPTHMFPEGALRGIAREARKGVSPALIESIWLRGFSVNANNSRSREAEDLLGGPLTVTIASREMFQLARSLKPGNPDAARELAIGAFLLALSDEAVIGFPAASAILGSPDFRDVAQLTESQHSRLLKLSEEWALPIDGSVVVRLYDTQDRMVQTPLGSPLKQEDIEAYRADFREAWGERRMFHSSRYWRLKGLADVVAIARTQPDPKALEFLTAFAEELTASTSHEDEKRWIKEAIESTGKRPDVRRFGKKVELEDLKPANPG